MTLDDNIISEDTFVTLQSWFDQLMAETVSVLFRVPKISDIQ